MCGVAGDMVTGLMRLEQEVKQRKQGWSYPPLSGAAAVMRRHQGGQLELGPRHEVDYRTLCLTTLTKLEKFALQRLNSGAVRVVCCGGAQTSW